MTRMKSLLNYMKVNGNEEATRYGPFAEWLASRREEGTWPYRRVLATKVSHRVSAFDDGGYSVAGESINYASQDYLGLAQDPRVNRAAKDAVDRYGVHSAGSPALMGRSQPMLDLADKLCAVTGRERCVLYPTGWAAGYGVIAGLIRRRDAIVIDSLAHNCLQSGVHVSQTVRSFAHNDVHEVERILQKLRQESPDRGIFLIIESLYSMDADSPNLPRMMAVARKYGAIVIVDVAHDFGSMGERGLGLLESLPLKDQPDVVMGSFSKTFASNGGFVLCSATTHDYLAFYSPTHVFSNALSPVQASVVLQAADIVFSDEGKELRRRLMDNVHALRCSMVRQGLYAGGKPSPIVPVFVGDERLARRVAGYIAKQGLLANLVEFPAVGRGKARFRFQVMPTHSAATAEKAAQVLADVVRALDDTAKSFAGREVAVAPIKK